MSWLWPWAVGQSGDAASGLKLLGGPHWNPATNNVSPAAPARPLPELLPLFPVCAVPHPAAPTPNTAPLAARPVSARKCLRLANHLTFSSSGGSAIEDSTCSRSSFMLPPRVSDPDFYGFERQGWDSAARRKRRPQSGTAGGRVHSHP